MILSIAKNGLWPQLKIHWTQTPLRVMVWAVMSACRVDSTQWYRCTQSICLNLTALPSQCLTSKPVTSAGSEPLGNRTKLPISSYRLKIPSSRNKAIVWWLEMNKSCRTWKLLRASFTLRSYFSHRTALEKRTKIDPSSAWNMPVRSLYPSTWEGPRVPWWLSTRGSSGLIPRLRLLPARI